MSKILTNLGVQLMPIAYLFVGAFLYYVGATAYCLWSFIMAFISWAVLFGHKINESKDI
jgi:hypothetical protein